MEIVEKLGKRLQELRIAKGMSQEKFAYFLEVDRSYYGLLERGKVNITIRNLHRITKQIEVPLSYFFEDFTEI